MMENSNYPQEGQNINPPNGDGNNGIAQKVPLTPVSAENFTNTQPPGSRASMQEGILPPPTDTESAAKEVTPEKETQQSAPAASKKSRRSIVLNILVVIIAIIVLFVLFGLLFPEQFLVFINIFWLVILAIVVSFLLLGILVLVGMKKEVNNILEILLEGSLTILDLIAFIRRVIKNFINLLKDFILRVTPVITYLVAFIIYYGLIYLYKYIGQSNDVTLLTIALTTALVVAVSFLNYQGSAEKPLVTWLDKFKARFKDYFGDATEVLIFVFFLTMDSTKLFFLPDELNVELQAKFADYNLMIRSFVIDSDIRITAALIALPIALEIFRFILKFIVGAIENFRIRRDQLRHVSQLERESSIDILKFAIRNSVKMHTDDIIKFIAYTTVLIIVFIFFPRLKLMTMVIASLTTIIMDFILPDRLKIQKQDDLISKIISKIWGI